MNDFYSAHADNPLAFRILPLLFFSQGRCHADFLFFALEADRNIVAPVIDSLKHSGTIAQDGNFYVLTREMTPGDIALCVEACGDDRPIFQMLKSFFNADICSMCSRAVAIASDLRNRKRIKELRFFYDITVKCFTACHPSPGDRHCCKRYIDASYKLLNLFGSFPFVLKRSLTWYFKVYSLARCISYNNQGSAISAAPGYLVANYLDKVAKIFYYDYMLCKNDRKNNNISDIKLSPYKSIKSFIEGDFLKSINSVYTENSNKIDFSYFSRTLYVFAACSALYIGESEVCINMLQMGKRHAEQVHNYSDARSLHAMMAYIYVQCGKLEEAREIIDAILQARKPDCLSYPELWAIRAQTVLYCRTGDMKKAYTTYKKYLEYAVTNEIIHIGYVSSSLMLEILTQWQIAGYPHPFGGNLLAELRHAQTSAARVLRHIGLRCEIEFLACQEGWGSRNLRPRIAECMDGIRGLTVPILYARAMLCVARFARAVGREQEARKSLEEVAAVCRRYDSLLPLADIRELLDGSGEPSVAATVAGGAASAPGHDEGFIVQSSVMQEILKKVLVLAPRDTSVLILGESGVGKEHIARQLHRMSNRKGRFVAVNLSSLPGELFESEFYGYEKGSFTGAVTNKEGLLELADGGTLFLDEVGDIPPAMQVKLLRVLQEKNFMRVGGTKLKQSDFRIISATNKDLEDAVRKGEFREDLYYRINVFPLKVPPLRKRRADIISIATYYLKFFLTKFNLPERDFSDDDLKFLASYRWPGNVRELRNYIERYVFLSDSERLLDHNRLLHEAVTAGPAGDDAPGGASDSFREIADHADACRNIFHALVDANGAWITGSAPTMEDIKGAYVEFMYVMTNGVISGPGGLADLLGISKVTAYAWVEKLHLREKYRIQVVKK